jgi:antitoxin MazE
MQFQQRLDPQPRLPDPHEYRLPIMARCDYNVITKEVQLVKVKLVRIGNSRGIRIPKAILEQCGLQEAAQLRVEKDRLVIAPEHRPRQGWEEAFSAAGPSSNDELLLNALPGSAFDREDWRW